MITETYKDFTTTANKGAIQPIIVPLDHISDKDINPRFKGLDLDNLSKLEGSVGMFDPIKLALINGELITYDGYHRLFVTKKAGVSDILAIIDEFDNMAEVIKAAFRANLSHGERLADSDIAMNLHKFYLQRLNIDPAVTKTSVGQENGLSNNRQTRTYINWCIVALECLELADINMIEKTKTEELFRLISEETAGEISEEKKLEVKNIYTRYGSETKMLLREAITYAKQGLDYDEEKEKERLEEEALAIAEAEAEAKAEALAEEGETELETSEETGNSENASSLGDDVAGAVDALFKEEASLEESETTTVEGTVETTEEPKKVVKTQLSPMLQDIAGKVKSVMFLTNKSLERTEYEAGDLEIMENIIRDMTFAKNLAFPEHAEDDNKKEEAFS